MNTAIKFLSIFWLVAAQANAQEPPVKTEQLTIVEESTCSPFPQQFNGLVLVDYKNNPKTGAATAIYGKLHHKHKLELWLMVRDDCSAQWVVAQKHIADPNPRKCEAGTECI